MNQQQNVIWTEIRPRLARYLPANLFNRLRELPDNLAEVLPDKLTEASDLLLEATQTLTPLHRVLVHYMPRYLLELDPTPDHPHGEMLQGTFLFADVSGFTALTEMLAEAGDAKGREVMNQIMNRLFSAVLDPIMASGGDMLIFVGDAALVYFPQKEEGRDLFQAIRAALRMQRAIAPFKILETEFGVCSLTMSIGLERGLAYAGVVGSSQRMELLVSGPATYGAMQAETLAESGQIFLGEVAQLLAKDQFTLDGPRVVDDLGDELGDYEISPPNRKRGSSIMLGLEISEILATMQVNLERVERLAPFLPEDMLALLVNTDRLRKLQSEFRPVAVQFINILGVEELAVNHGPELATQVFQTYFNKAKQIIQQHEGIVSQIDAYITGFFFLNTFGVPKSHEGTTRYAVSAALQLSQALDRINQQFQLNPPLQQRGGITYGLTFNGEIGATYRRESVIVGPAVNRAARLMSKAQPGQIILDSQIWDQIRGVFIGETLPTVQLKGIEGDVVIVNVRNLRRGTRLPPLQRPLVARQVEQQQLAAAMQSLQQDHHSSAWMVTGETGIGKTALMASLAEVAKEQSLTLLVGYCQPHNKHRPLSPWLDLIVGWLELDQDQSPAVQRDYLYRRLATLELTGLDQDLADLLFLPHIELSEAESPDLESEFIGPTLILELLEQLTKRQPLLIILEDIHWLDNESRLLLNQLLDELADWSLMIVLTGHEALPREEMTTLVMPPLPEPALISVAERALGANSLDESLANWICQQAGGNPLYVEELCHALQQSEAVWLDKSIGRADWTGYIPALPLSLHELLLARLDELPPVEQDVLKRAAILGLSFKDETILQLCQPQLKPTETHNALDEAVQAAFLTANGSTYQFSHPLMQEAIYATLSFEQRQNWHKKIADWLAQHKANQEQHLEDIAYHYLRSSDASQAAKFGLLAGDRAREREAYTGAFEYYQQVYALAEVPRKQRQQAAEKQGDVLALQGNYSAAIEAYTQAVNLDNLVAAQKRAIIAADETALAELSFNDRLKPWANGSRAWLLAQADQRDDALALARSALETAEGPVHTALSVLVQQLEDNRPMDDYVTWLERFVSAILQLGLSTIDLLDMPAVQSSIINKLARQRRMNVAELAEALQQPVDQLQQILDELVAQGHVKEVTIKEQIWYKAHFARKVKKKLSDDLWSALDF